MTTVRFHYRPRTFSGRAVGKLLWLCMICLSAVASVSAQKPPVHWQNAGTMPPGAIGGQRLSRGGPLSGYFQPVEIRVPRGARIAVTTDGQFESETANSLQAGLLVAPVYRLRVTEIPRNPGAEVFPTIEIIDRIYPPSGQRKRFPIPIEITQEDLRLALEGRFVTRVIYLEDPDQAAPIAAVPEKQNWFEAPTGTNLLSVADRMGRPVAILRIGSRLPSLAQGNGQQFNYGSPPVELLEHQLPPGELPSNANGSDDYYRPQSDKIASDSDTSGRSNISQGDTASDLVDFELEDAEEAPEPDDHYSVGLASHNSRKAHRSRTHASHSVKRYLTLPQEAWSGPPLTPEQAAAWRPPGIAGPWPRDEYLRDGGDFATPAAVRKNGELTGLEQDDTVAHFDTLDGRTIVQPSNRVHIYSPRFGAVRRVSGIAANSGHHAPTGVSDIWKLGQQESRELAKSSIKQEQPIGGLGIRGSSVYRGRQQGGGVELPVRLVELKGAMAPYEDFHIMRAGKFDQRQKARLAVAVDAALVWEDTESVQVMIHNQKAFELTKDETLEQVYGLKEPSNPRLRIIKIASDDTALPGDTIDFTLRFDNVGDQVIGNVTVSDNLSTRLEYVSESSECSKKSEFFTTPNGTGSHVLRWEITDPLRPGEGGVIRFRCKIR